MLHPTPGLRLPPMSIPAASTSQIVTLPHIPELFDPNFLDILLPPRPALSPHANVSAAVPKSAFMDALKSVAYHRLTENGSPAFSSTLSCTLDAFQSLSVHMETLTIDSVLARAWVEDPALTLKIIWNTRSIHDGKSDKELFYRYVHPSRVRFLIGSQYHVRLHLGLLAGSMSTTPAQQSAISLNSFLPSVRSNPSVPPVCHTVTGRTFSTSLLSLPLNSSTFVTLSFCTAAVVALTSIK